MVELQSKVGESQSHRWASRIRSHLRMRRTGHIECDTVTSLPRTHGIHTSPAPHPSRWQNTSLFCLRPLLHAGWCYFIMIIYFYLLAVLWLPLGNPTPRRSLVVATGFHSLETTRATLRGLPSRHLGLLRPRYLSRRPFSTAFVPVTPRDNRDCHFPRIQTY